MSSAKERVTDSAFGLTNEKREGRCFWGGDALKWSPTGKARGTLLHAPVERHPPSIVGTHSSTAKGHSLLLPG